MVLVHAFLDSKARTSISFLHNYTLSSRYLNGFHVTKQESFTFSLILILMNCSFGALHIDSWSESQEGWNISSENFVFYTKCLLFGR